MPESQGARVDGILTDNSDSTTASVRLINAATFAFAPEALEETSVSGEPVSIVYRQFDTLVTTDYSTLYISLDLDSDIGARVFLNGEHIINANMAIFGGFANTPTAGAPADFLPLSRVYQIGPDFIELGSNTAGTLTHTVAVELFSEVDAGTTQSFNLKVEAFERIDLTGPNWLALSSDKFPDGVRTIIGETADVRALSDNYVIMRYRPVDDADGWSDWTTPALAEGWIKRVLAGINPFNQRVTDLFSNTIDTDASILQAAGPRWEGDIALNLQTINDFGLIEIYETVLNRGRMLSIDAGINFGPANDALLLVVGYLNDLYLLVGNEAKADALNPTIGIGTADNTYGDIATSMFSFEGQVSTLLAEELALWRGRDDFFQPGVEVSPVFNRLVWNYTRGIDSGEVIYALNYNIQEDPTGELDGVIDAADAAELFPQGHGDAYGHFLTALKGYYGLFTNENFTWVPRIEAVNVLGVPVSVDYQDERKFATAALAAAEAGQQVMELSWRRDYQDIGENGWSHFEETRSNNTTRTLPSTRYWGVDHWVSRTQQSAYLNWVVGNAMVPEADPDPSHEGIQVIDRSTVLELKELTFLGEELRQAFDNAEGGLNPLGLHQDSVAFDINPHGDGTIGSGFALGQSSHFGQVLGRAKRALNNAVIAFDDAKDVTRLMRSDQDSLNEFKTKVDQQEFAFTNELIEIYGTPYPDDIGPGRTYSTGYTGPDLFHYRYVDDVELDFNGKVVKEDAITFRLDTQTHPSDWDPVDRHTFFFAATALEIRDPDDDLEDTSYDRNVDYIEFSLDPHGFLEKPETWLSRRASPGELQVAVMRIINARNRAYEEMERHDGLKYRFDRLLEVMLAKFETLETVQMTNEEILELNRIVKGIRIGGDVAEAAAKAGLDKLEQLKEVALSTIPDNTILGIASGGDLLTAAKAAIEGTYATASTVAELARYAAFGLVQVSAGLLERQATDLHFDEIVPAEIKQTQRELVYAVDLALKELNRHNFSVNRALVEMENALMEFRALESKGLRLQQEREIFRQRAAVVVQGSRTRDAAFRLFRNEKLERYKTLFDLAARFAFLATQAYDYETGLLHTDEGRDFIERVIRSRALGVVVDGEPQFAGSNQGDPGLSSILAEMEADWEVLKGRLGFNNPDVYGTTFSLRSENFRILPGADGDDEWRNILEGARVANILDDADVRRFCLQIDEGDGLPVPGIILTFGTTIANRLNYFGNALAAGDSNFSPTSFATKVFSVGVVLKGYLGMADPALNSGVVGQAPVDPPDLTFLDDDALAATPYIYFFPVGVDSMRTPPLGDESVIRTWQIQDVTIPMPFNIGDSAFSTRLPYQSSESLTEPIFDIRKHQAFRPVSNPLVFAGDNGRLLPSTFTNSRLIGRSVWNSQWKVVIPGRVLLNDPDEGLERFIRTVKDIQIHLETYSYAGN